MGPAAGLAAGLDLAVEAAGEGQRGVGQQEIDRPVPALQGEGLVGLPFGVFGPRVVVADDREAASGGIVRLFERDLKGDGRGDRGSVDRDVEPPGLEGLAELGAPELEGASAYE